MPNNLIYEICETFACLNRFSNTNLCLQTDLCLDAVILPFVTAFFYPKELKICQSSNHLNVLHDVSLMTISFRVGDAIECSKS